MVAYIIMDRRITDVGLQPQCGFSQKATEILTKMVAKKEKHISEKTGNSPMHIPANEISPTDNHLDQKTAMVNLSEKRKIFSWYKRLVC